MDLFTSVESVVTYLPARYTSSPERKKQKLDLFADLREYTAPSTSASYVRVKSEAELAEYKSLTVPAPVVDPLRFVLNFLCCCHVGY